MRSLRLPGGSLCVDKGSKLVCPDMDLWADLRCVVLDL